MKLEQVQNIAQEFISFINPYCKRWEIVGSIRRKKPEVKDIDIVLIPKDLDSFFKIKETVGKISKVSKSGTKIISTNYNGIMIDLYIADDEHYETKKMIFTGSISFNRMLCFNALQKEMKIKADGTGLIDKNGKILAKDEKEILLRVLGRYYEPEERI
jgi:DNA polymerase/3'-5' exonuclease PolX